MVSKLVFRQIEHALTLKCGVLYIPLHLQARPAGVSFHYLLNNKYSEDQKGPAFQMLCFGCTQLNFVV